MSAFNYQPCDCEKCLVRNDMGVSDYIDSRNNSYTSSTWGGNLTVSMLKDLLSTLDNHTEIEMLTGYEIKQGKIYLEINGEIRYE